MLPLQFGISAQLAEWVGGSVRAACVSFVVGAFSQPISLLRVAGVVVLAGGVALVRLS